MQERGIVMRDRRTPRGYGLLQERFTFGTRNGSQGSPSCVTEKGLDEAMLRFDLPIWVSVSESRLLSSTMQLPSARNHISAEPPPVHPILSDTARLIIGTS